MVAEKVSDVGVGAQGLTSADGEPAEKGNSTHSTSQGVRRGSRFDSEFVIIPLLSPVSQIRTSSIVWMGNQRRGNGAWVHFRVRDQPQPVGFC
jgi:hypothetical protein